MALTGFDIANVNGPAAITAALRGAFIIFKSSEGTGFKDGYHDGWANQARAAGKLVGHYHYAHLTNSPTAEADWFVRCASPRAGEVMALDFEPYGQPVADATFPGWAITFLDQVNRAVGGQCWIYLNDDMASRMTSHADTAQLVRLHAAPLWKARYAASIGNLFGWPSAVAWQWGGTGIDSDTYYGDAKSWTGSHSAPTPLEDFMATLTDPEKTLLMQAAQIVVDLNPILRATYNYGNWGDSRSKIMAGQLAATQVAVNAQKPGADATTAGVKSLVDQGATAQKGRDSIAAALTEQTTTAQTGTESLLAAHVTLIGFNAGLLTAIEQSGTGTVDVDAIRAAVREEVAAAIAAIDVTVHTTTT